MQTNANACGHIGGLGTAQAFVAVGGRRVLGPGGVGRALHTGPGGAEAQPLDCAPRVLLLSGGRERQEAFAQTGRV